MISIFILVREHFIVLVFHNHVGGVGLVLVWESCIGRKLVFVVGLSDAVLYFEGFDRFSEDSEHFFVLGFLGLEELGRLFTELSG